MKLNWSADFHGWLMKPNAAVEQASGLSNSASGRIAVGKVEDGQSFMSQPWPISNRLL